MLPVKTGALVFACPRDNGANALKRIFREGPPSRIRRNANHAITEYGILYAKTQRRSKVLLQKWPPRPAAMSPRLPIFKAINRLPRQRHWPGSRINATIPRSCHTPGDGRSAWRRRSASRDDLHHELNNAAAS
jgi:hypothetical protein